MVAAAGQGTYDFSWSIFHLDDLWRHPVVMSAVVRLFPSIIPLQ